MSYILDPKPPITTEIRRVIREVLIDATGRAGAPGDDIHDDVHEVRKSLKKARAVLKLVRPHLADYSARKNTYRDLGRRLSGVRDAAAVVENIDLLHDELVDALEPGELDTIRARLVDQRDERRDEAARLLRGMHDELSACVADVSTMKLASPDEHVLVEGLKREYRRGRAWARSLHSETSHSEFHEWRKRAKEHRYHLELLFGESPEVDRMHELTDVLGHIQDITVLLDLEDLPRPMIDRLEQVRRRKKGRALEIGRSFYEQPPAQRVDEVLARWRGSDPEFDEPSE